jgi:hypothetical protein
MALRDRLSTGPLRPPPKTCSVCWISGRISKDDRDVLHVMLADLSHTGTSIAAALSEEYDTAIGGEAVQRHRRMHMDPES